MAVLNYAELYQQALDQPYKVDRRFNALYDLGGRNIRWVGAKTVQIPKITVGGMTDVNRDSIGTYTRKVDNDWETKTLTHDREFRTLVDPMDVDETNMAVTIANITNVFNTEEKIPEMDKYMASKLLAEYTALGGTANTTAITNANILSTFDTFMEEMDDAEVPEEGRILYLTPALRKMLKEAAGISREINVDMPGSRSLNRLVSRLDEVEIITVPSARMKSAYDFTNGAVPAVGAKQIHMILLHPSAVIAPEKYDFVSLEQPSATTGGKYLYYERLYWDVFLYEQKVAGVKINMAA